MNLYTDGSCLGNPGPGGWAAMGYTSGGVLAATVCGGETNTTNNQMELKAAIYGLEKILSFGRTVTVYTDSTYVQKGITEWMPKWQAKNWKTSTGAPVKNVELWKQLLEIVEKFHAVEWQWVKAHNNHPENEKVDTLARSVAKLISSDTV